MRIDSGSLSVTALTFGTVLTAATIGCGGGLSDPDASGPVEFGASDTVPVFGIWELEVENDRVYRNPYDFREIELRGTFGSPSGDSVEVFGFHDGEVDDPAGERTGVWRIRFRPDEAGRWTYRYRWTDGTPGAEGTFLAEEAGALAPLEVDPNATWYFRTARGEPFHFRGYDLHTVAPYTESGSLVGAFDEIRSQLDTMTSRGYNLTMVGGAVTRATSDRNVWKESWWRDGDRLRFDVESWRAFERVLEAARERGIYVITFAGMIYQGEQYAFDEFERFLRYWIARFGAFPNFFGYSPTWEWPDIWEPGEVDRIMGYVRDHTPYPVLLSAHDCSDSRFVDWLSFSMRQGQTRTLLGGNGRHAGQQQGSCDGSGGVARVFEDAPIIGSEDIWEVERGVHGFPRDATEVRRAAWGEMLAGVMPLYSEWHPAPPPRGGRGSGEAEVRRMFDFIYGETRYREHRPLDGLVSREDLRAAAGIAGDEYLVYAVDGGGVGVDLSTIPASRSFSVLWFDPASGARRTAGPVAGGATVTLNSPFDGDAVLLLRRTE